ncbi:MAG: 3D domain-containing protein [Firmicutes bacterium]|jgi:3D (Asp-Asp-Asp) domain-containing protein|nr:3D domain-containing protein [Bacillota bacterium]
MHSLFKGASLFGAFALSVALNGTSLAASVPSTHTLEESHPAMQQVLHWGSCGHWVMTLQADLALLGYVQVGPIDGFFGRDTEQALKAFERRHGFLATGVTSPAVWQDILAGFGLVPPVQSTSAPKAPAGQRGASSSSGQSTASTGGNSSSANNPSGSVLPAAFPNGGTPVAEPSLPSPSAGVEGQFTPSVRTIDGRPVLEAFHMVATAYGPSLADNYPYGPVDAFGQPLEDGMVAVDPNVIPLRSIVYVTGYTDNYLPSSGFLGQAMDTGGAIQGDRIDIFINANPTVISDFGIQQVTVYVLGQ